MADDDPPDSRERERRIDAFIRRQQQGTTPETPADRVVRLAREHRAAVRALQTSARPGTPEIDSSVN